MNATIIFANYAAQQLRTYETPMYDLFADIDGDRDAISVVEPFVRDAQMDEFRKQNHLYISFADENAEFYEYGEVFDAYISDLTGDYNDYGCPYHFPKKFFDEVWIFFNCKEEGKKCMEEFDPKNGKVEEVTNMLTYNLTNDISLKIKKEQEMISFVIPSFITLIGSNAFSRCSSLAKIEIPTSITEICESAFKGCLSLKQVVFELSSIFSIGELAFSGCSLLIEISISSSVTEIKKEAFICCSSLLKVSFCKESSIKSIGDYAFFKCGKLEEVSIPPSVKKIGAYSFGECKSLKKVVILFFIHEIGEKSFSGCSSLSQVIFNPNCEINESHSSSIGNYAFSGCEKLKEISIPSFISEIGDAAFQNCSKIVSIKFESPSSLVSIGSSFCEGYSSLETISIPSSVKSIGLNSFQNCSSLEKIELPSIMKKEFSKYLKGMNHKIKINYI